MAQLRRDTGTSAEDYPYDAAAAADRLEGLERLRAIEDRLLAGYLHVLYVQAERNSRSGVVSKPALDLERLRREAERALAGGYGADAKELAAYLLLDDAGRQRFDEDCLSAFAASLRELRLGER